MRKSLICVAIASLLGSPVAPALAAELLAEAQPRDSRFGAFAGARLRLGLDGPRERMRAGLAVAPSLHSFKDGASRHRIGEGLEFGLVDRRPPSLTVAGHQISGVSDARTLPEGQRQNVTPAGWVAIGAGVILVAGAVVLGVLFSEADSNTD